MTDITRSLKEHSIRFRNAEVRAILDGRKTMTRRIAPLTVSGRVSRGRRNWHVDDPEAITACPYGQPGDRVWVREKWGVITHAFNSDGDMIDWIPDRPTTKITEMAFGNGYYSGNVIYAADGPYEWAGDDGGGIPRSAWLPSTQMPRTASRMTLQIIAVRLECLQDVSDDDAISEGIYTLHIGSGYLDRYSAAMTQWSDAAEGSADVHEDPRRAFRDLWEVNHGPRSWASNPMVWAVEFTQLEQPSHV